MNLKKDYHWARQEEDWEDFVNVVTIRKAVIWAQAFVDDDLHEEPG
jgi:hypothetical protein